MDGEREACSPASPEDGPAPKGCEGMGRCPRPSLSSRSDEALVSIALGQWDNEEPATLEDRDSAFCELAKRHYSAVRSVVRAIMGTSADVDDAVQSAFLSAYRSLGSLKNRSKFRYWVRIIAVNEAHNLLRDQRRHHTRDYAGIKELDALLTLPESAQDRVPPLAAEAAWLIEELTGRLPAQYMKVLYLRYYLDYTVNEVADMLGIQPGLVKWRANRARKLAKQALSDSDSSPETILENGIRGGRRDE